MNVIINEYDEDVFLENLALFKAKLFLLVLENLKVSDEVKIEILKKSVQLIEEGFEEL